MIDSVTISMLIATSVGLSNSTKSEINWTISSTVKDKQLK